MRVPVGGGLDRSLITAQQPPFEKRHHPVDLGQQVFPCSGMRPGHRMDKPFMGQLMVTRPAVSTHDRTGVHNRAVLPHRNQVRVSLWDRVSRRHRTVSIEYLEEMANADAQQLARMEMKLRPEVVVENLFTDLLYGYYQPGGLENFKPPERLALMKFLYSLQASFNKKKATKDNFSIAEMRRYALRLDKKEATSQEDEGQSKLLKLNCWKKYATSHMRRVLAAQQPNAGTIISPSWIPPTGRGAKHLLGVGQFSYIEPTSKTTKRTNNSRPC